MRGNAGSRASRLGPACAVRRRMDARTRVPVAAVMAALMLSASAAHGQTTAPKVPSSSEEPQVTVPSSSEAPQVSVPSSSDERQVPVPTPEPGAEPKLAAPDSIWQDANPDAPPAGATSQLYGPPPTMVHKKRRGFVVAGAIVFGLLYSVQLIAALGVGAADDQGCNSVARTNKGFSWCQFSAPGSPTAPTLTTAHSRQISYMAVSKRPGWPCCSSGWWGTMSPRGPLETGTSRSCPS